VPRFLPVANRPGITKENDVKLLKIPVFVRKQVEADIKDNRIICAIKAVRKHSGCSLREAKDAVDLYQGKITESASKACLMAPWKVKKITIQQSDGEDIEVDLEGLQLKFLQEMPVIGIDDVGELLELVGFIRKWQGDVEQNSAPSV